MNTEGRDIYEEEEVAAFDTPVRKNALRGGSTGKVAGIPSNHSPSTQSINFQIYPATGGYVAEIAFYDEKTDSHCRSLHVISTTDYSELGDHISKIITIEMLRR